MHYITNLIYIYKLYLNKHVCVYVKKIFKLVYNNLNILILNNIYSAVYITMNRNDTLLYRLKNKFEEKNIS